MGLCWDYIGHCTNWKIWTNGSRALGQSAAIFTEKSRANSAKSLANVSCHERGKKYLTWQNASNAEPPPGIDERHLLARGKRILVSTIYFADGTLATALSPVGPQVDHRSLRRRSCVPAQRARST